VISNGDIPSSTGVGGVPIMEEEARAVVVEDPFDDAVAKDRERRLGM
jgi:carbamate kinase